MLRARVRACIPLLAAALLATGAAAQQKSDEPPAALPAVSAPLSAKVSPRHRDGAWSALDPAEKDAVRRYIDAAPDQAQAEADFVHVAWRLMLLQELKENPEGLSEAEREQHRQRTSQKLDEDLSALAEPTRARLLELLADACKRAGYIAPGRAAAVAPAPAPPAAAPAAPPATYKEAARRAQDALRRRDWTGALAAARIAAERAPQAELLADVLKAAALSMLGRHEEALTEVRTTLRIRPKSSGLYSILAFTLNRAGRYQEAQNSVDASFEGQPDRAWAWYQLAYSQAGTGDRTGSLRSLEQAALLDAPGYEPRRRKALAAADAPEMLALFTADPGLDAAPFMSVEPGAAARSRLLTLWAWPAGGAAALLLLFWLRRPLTAALVRMGMAAAGTPLPLPLPTPISGLPPMTGPSLSLPGLPAGYRVLRQIGSGGMGAVYEAEDVSLQRRVAVKRMRDEIRSDPRERDRFLVEARTVAQLRHPNIVDIYGIFEHEGEVFLVFEFLDGKALDLVIYENGRLTIPETKGVLAQVCSALTYAHAHGVIHRDLKPPNIMITRDNRVKVMDFGVARQAHDALTRLSVSATAAGTPPYMAPESETGTVRAESDLYSLGICLYEMLTGARPFDGTSAGMLFTKMNMVFVPPSGKAPGLPAALDAFFSRALQADPEKRPRTAAAFLEEFLAAAETTGRAA
jgi:tRNA A-37 threonylcarbamoyl transferase component Bud32/tetratricopeptide (TPR) repeat protein